MVITHQVKAFLRVLRHVLSQKQAFLDHWTLTIRLPSVTYFEPVLHLYLLFILMRFSQNVRNE